MNRIQSVQARASAQLSAPADSDRPTIPAPAYAACRAAALRAQIAYELLVEDRLAALRAGASERETWPAPAPDGDWDCEVES